MKPAAVSDGSGGLLLPLCVEPKVHFDQLFVVFRGHLDEAEESLPSDILAKLSLSF